MLLAACVNQTPAEPEAPVEAIALATTLDEQFAVGAGAVAASANDGNVPANTVDGSMSTRWSASGDGQWIRYDLGSVSRVAFVKIAFYNGASRVALIDVETSVDGTTWTTALEGASSTLTTAMQTFDFADVPEARFVRIVGHGNSSNAWNSFTEVGVFGGAPSQACAPHGTFRCTASGRQVCNFGTWTNMACPTGTTCSGAGICDYAPCVPGTVKCDGTTRFRCYDDGFFHNEPCPSGGPCIGNGQCGCAEGNAYCEGHIKWVCNDGVFQTESCGFGSTCVGEGQCSECSGNDSMCEGGDRFTCSNGIFVAQGCPAGTVCTGAGNCTTQDFCQGGTFRCAAGGRQVCENGSWIPEPCDSGTFCTGAGTCLPTGISSISVNDNTDGNDGVPNNTQWSIESNFPGTSPHLAFNDRTFTIGAIPMAASHLVGKPWIRTAADSKTYTGTPLATATVTGSFVYVAIDNRHNAGNPPFLTNNGFTKEAGYTLTVSENGTARTYGVWKKAITAQGAPFALPSIGAATAPCYFVIVQ